MTPSPWDPLSQVWTLGSGWRRAPGRRHSCAGVCIYIYIYIYICIFIFIFIYTYTYIIGAARGRARDGRARALSFSCDVVHLSAVPCEPPRPRSPQRAPLAPRRRGPSRTRSSGVGRSCSSSGGRRSPSDTARLRVTPLGGESTALSSTIYF